jgi:hypothetical protein
MGTHEMGMMSNNKRSAQGYISHLIILISKDFPAEKSEF